MRTSPWAPPELRPGVTAVVIIIGLFTLAFGIWAFFAPTSFAEFVAFPYNRHLLHDVGAFQIGIGTTMLLALMWKCHLIFMPYPPPAGASPLYVARGRRIGCEGAIDRLPHGPSSAQRPLNSEGRRAPLSDRESPNSCPGRRPSRRARIGKAGPRMEGSSQMTQTPTYYAGIDVAKDRLDVVLRPSGEYMEATNDERGIRSVVRLLCVRRTWRSGGTRSHRGARAARRRGPRSRRGAGGDRQPQGQLRDFAKATGKLAKTDRIDAAVLAHFAEAVKPEPRPLADEHARELSAVVLRRRQILAMTTAEANRARTAPKAVRKRIEAHLRWLRKELARVVKACSGAGREGEPAVEGEGGPPHERPRGRSHALGHAACGAA